MSPAARLAVFGLVLAAVFAAAAVAGGALGPFDRSVAAHDEAPAGDPHDAAPEDDAHGGALPGGLAIAADGLRLVPSSTSLRAGERQTFAFALEDERGEPLRDYDVTHERELHLIVVRRDFGAFLHLHPKRQPDGTWATTLRLPDAGAYRAFADFSTGGEKRSLGVDLFVYGGRAAQPPEPAAERWAVVDGYRAVLRPEARRAGLPASLGFTVMRDGRAIGVDEYLGARGHLVVLREGDLAYLHTHAEEDDLEFETTFPSAGRYRAFLQFRVGGAVRTAAFDVRVRG